MRIFRRYCPSAASNYISYMETRFSAAARLYIPQERTSNDVLCNGWDFNPSRMYLLQRQKRNEIGSQRQTFVWYFATTRGRAASASSKEGNVHSLGDRALHYTNASSNWRGATDTVKYLNTRYLSNARPDFSLYLEVNF